MINAFIIEGVSGLRRKGLDHKQSKTPQGCCTQTNCLFKQPNQNQIEVVTYTVNNRCAIGFQTGGFVFSVAPFFLGGGGLESTRQWGGGSRGGGVPAKNLVWTRAGGGGVDVVHNQGVWGRGVHGLVMMVHKSLMSVV